LEGIIIAQTHGNILNRFKKAFGWASKVLWTDKMNFATYGPKRE